MLVRLRKNLKGSELESVLARCRELGCEPRVLGSERDLLELDTPARPDLRSALEDSFGVAQVIDAGNARELAYSVGEPLSVHVGQARFGAGSIALIAGPCAIEDAERTLEIARAVQERGATALRGGAFKPRTSPYSFQGSRHAGLEILARVRTETGLAIVTEALDPRDVEAVGEVADMYQVGSRNMANTPLLTELGKTRTPVLLKRGFAATLREFLLAAEFVLAGGNQNVVLCERGIRAFDNTTRNVLDVGAVAALKRMTHLPVIVDPSHAAGRSDLVRALARAGIAAGADGLLCEVHPEPSEVHSDGAQAVDYAELERIVSDARALAALDGRTLVTPEKEALR
jgi:3-deoxy-7-phosphoheptulonate synthase